jgi:putative addiction module component (TIGR02574 family)
MTYAAILNLPPSERLQLLEAIWDSLTEVPEAIPVSQELRDELERRLQNYYRNPNSARLWEEIKDEIFRRK